MRPIFSEFNPQSAEACGLGGYSDLVVIRLAGALGEAVRS